MFWATLLLFNVAAGSITVCISVYAPSVGVANLVATVVFLIQLLFGGLLVNVDSLSNGISWLRYLSIFNYAFELLMTNELEGLVMSFDAPNYPAVPVSATRVLWDSCSGASFWQSPATSQPCFPSMYLI